MNSSQASPHTRKSSGRAPLNILVTGANGYIGRRLVSKLLSEGHIVYACVRDIEQITQSTLGLQEYLNVIEIDFLRPPKGFSLPKTLDAAYYLMHAMSDKQQDFISREQRTAQCFVSLLNHTCAKQIIYLGGIANAETLSAHLHSRRQTEDILSGGKAALTVLRAGIIVGSGSASFEIIRDLVEKLPLMIAPKWLKTKCQPIAIRDVITYLIGVLHQAKTYHSIYDIGGPEILSYQEMLLKYAKVRKLQRTILTVPIMTPKLSSYWLYFITSVSYSLAKHLISSLRAEVICKKLGIENIVDAQPMLYEEALQAAFARIAQNEVTSSWKTSSLYQEKRIDLEEAIEVPREGCFVDQKKRRISAQERDRVIENIWHIGGERGWYYGNILWKIRGWMDRIAGGVGLRRGRRNASNIEAGDVIDFWRVIIAHKSVGKLLLFAEMKLPGEAWLSFELKKQHNGDYQLLQKATFRPKGVLGRLYWYAVEPLHFFIFRGMIRNLISYEDRS